MKLRRAGDELFEKLDRKVAAVREECAKKLEEHTLVERQRTAHALRMAQHDHQVSGAELKARLEAERDAEVGELRRRLTEAAGQCVLHETGLLEARKFVEQARGLLKSNGIKYELPTVDPKYLADVNALRDELAAARTALARYPGEIEALEKRGRRLETNASMCTAVMVDQIKVLERKELGYATDIQRLKARVAELEHQLIHGGSDAEAQIRQKLIASMKAEATRAANEESKLQLERSREAIRLMEAKAARDLEEARGEQAKAILKCEKKHAKAMAQMEEAHAAECARIKEVWSKKAAISSSAVGALKTDSADLLSRQARLMQMASVLLPKIKQQREHLPRI